MPDLKRQAGQFSPVVWVHFVQRKKTIGRAEGKAKTAVSLPPDRLGSSQMLHNSSAVTQRPCRKHQRAIIRYSFFHIWPLSQHHQLDFAVVVKTMNLQQKCWNKYIFLQTVEAMRPWCHEGASRHSPAWRTVDEEAPDEILCRRLDLQHRAALLLPRCSVTAPLSSLLSAIPALLFLSYFLPPPISCSCNTTRTSAEILIQKKTNLRPNGRASDAAGCELFSHTSPSQLSGLSLSYSFSPPLFSLVRQLYVFKALVPLRHQIQLIHKGSLVSSKLELWSVFLASHRMPFALRPHRSRPYFKTIYSNHCTVRNALKGRSETLIQIFQRIYCIIILAGYCEIVLLYKTIAAYESRSRRRSVCFYLKKFWIM